MCVCLCADIAVSAPFEKQEDEAEGTVYIYLGSGETYINEKPEEVRQT